MVGFGINGQPLELTDSDELNSGVEVPKWRGATEWDVIVGNNKLRILSITHNGRTIFGFSNDHYTRIFDVLVTL